VLESYNISSDRLALSAVRHCTRFPSATESKHSNLNTHVNSLLLMTVDGSQHGLLVT